ncbi:MAG: hypothetical protein IK139_04095, partial [Lachnospiraceae bacterium]|nr:hypothetical protein [Lachnospiraceae bacterium]
MKRNDKLIQRKFNSYLVPGVMMSVALQAGNIIDCILVSRLIDLDGLTAISLSYPILILLQLTGLTLGAGSAAVISVMLGRRQMEEASEVFSAVILAAIGISLVFTVLSFIIVRPIASLLTPSPVLAEMLSDYLFVFMLLCPILNLYFLISNVITVDNCPKLGAAGAVIYNVANLSSEFVFLK